MGNHLYYGDNLTVLRENIADNSVDLVYLDPPFNSNASYNVLFKGPQGNESAAQIEAFDDKWSWGEEAEAAFREVLTGGNSDVSEMLRAIRVFLGENDMMAYLTMMAVRLIELHRVLKDTGSLYLHCDPTASHYLKILLDAVFGKENYKNEIIWRRTNAHNVKTKLFPRVHDTLLFFSKSNTHIWNKTYQDYSPEQLKRYKLDKSGRLFTGQDLTMMGGSAQRKTSWRGTTPASNRAWGASLDQRETWWKQGLILKKKDGTPRLDGRKVFLDEKPGKVSDSIWTDIPRIGNTAEERLPYPTQKPVALLERIVQASSNEGDVILDPFCGCGTTVHAAQKLGRSWIGIDVTHLAIGLIERRLKEAFEGIEFETHGTPKDLSGAQALADADKYEFEKWALSLIPNAQPWKGGKKGADKGIDGVLYVGKKSDRCIISVKGGKNIGVAMIRDLVGVLDREKAPMGIFLTLTPPTKPMVTEAAAAGMWDIEGLDPVPRVQIVTINDLLTSITLPLRIPMARGDTYKKAAKEDITQGSLDL